jgi:hypothetical protein
MRWTSRRKAPSGGATRTWGGCGSHRGAMVIRTPQGPALGWRRTGWHRWTTGVGFLALRELQAEVDASAAVGGIVAGGAG